MIRHLLLITLMFTIGVNSIYHVQAPLKECSCYCSDSTAEDATVCQKLSRFEKELTTVKDAIEHRTRYINEIKELREKLEWQEYFVETLSKEMESFRIFIAESPKESPHPETLIMKPEDEMQNDSSGGGTSTVNDDGEFRKDVSNLFEKVKVVENMTMEVQEELKSERRVRRHLEEDLNETRSSVQNLGDQFLNFSQPVDSRVTHVEEIVFSTLENLNKTLFEDHLQKLYYKVDSVYKNETRKFGERLESVETELRDASNTSTIQKLAEDLRNTTNLLYHLNDTITEKIAADGIRLGKIEAMASKLDEFETLTDQIDALMNSTDLMQSGITDVWNDIQYVRHLATKLESEFELRISLIENNTATIEHQDLQDLTSEVSLLKINLSKTEDLVANIQRDVNMLEADVAITENKIHDVKLLLDTGFSELETKLDNITELWIRNFDVKFEEIEQHQKLLQENKETLERKSKFLEDLKDVSGPKEIGELKINQIPTSNFSYDIENEIDYDFKDEDVTDIISLGKEKEQLLCSLPINNDTRLLIAEEIDETGQQSLIFRCRPIGQYAFIEELMPVRCENGKWSGTIPECVEPLSEQEIDTLANELASNNPCLTAKFAPDFPDPTDCSRYFKCWNGKSDRLRCPKNLHFNSISKRCENSSVSRCTPFDTSETQKLKNLPPTILVEPDNVDKPNGFMSTSSSGHLVIYPRTNFKLHCIYPENMWGHPEWHLPNSSSVSIFSTKFSNNRITVSLSAPTLEDSGIYTCRTPFGNKLSITVTVEAVTCPEIEMNSTGSYDVFYRPHPEVEPRIMTTQVQFFCVGGRTFSAFCLANGSWSRSPPTEEECPPTSPHVGMPWECPDIVTENEPNLLLEPHGGDKMVSFKCAGKTKLLGNPFTRCIEGGKWSHSKLPRCIAIPK